MNLLRRAIIQPSGGGPSVSDFFSVDIYTGSSIARSITTDTQPDLVWIRKRDAASNHILTDSDEGAGSYLRSDTTPGYVVNAQTLTSFNVDGYSLGTDTQVNLTTSLFVSWSFTKAEKFFDVISYTGNGSAGREITHALGAQAGLCIVKQTNAARAWACQHVSRGGTKALSFTTAAEVTSSTWWNNTTMSDTSVTLGNNNGVNGNGLPYIMYLFAHDPSPEGLIQCGEYLGNGIAGVGLGPEINLGWTPQYIIIKNATATAGWLILDTARGIVNGGNDPFLYANSTAAENTLQDKLNLTATGFVINTNSTDINTNGQTYIYMAIREAS